MLLTAAGGAYFANCPETEREHILSVLRSGASGERQAALAGDAGYVRSLVKRVREYGVSTNHGGWIEQRNISAVAVPLCVGERVLGSLNVVYLSRGLKPAEAEAKFVEPLVTIAQRIARAMDEPRPSAR